MFDVTVDAQVAVLSQYMDILLPESARQDTYHGYLSVQVTSRSAAAARAFFRCSMTQPKCRATSTVQAREFRIRVRWRPPPPPPAPQIALDSKIASITAHPKRRRTDEPTSAAAAAAAPLTTKRVRTDTTSTGGAGSGASARHSVGGSNPPALQTLTPEFWCDDSLFALLSSHQPLIAKRWATSATLNAFLVELKDLTERSLQLATLNVGTTNTTATAAAAAVVTAAPPSVTASYYQSLLSELNEMRAANELASDQLLAGGAVAATATATAPPPPPPPPRSVRLEEMDRAMRVLTFVHTDAAEREHRLTLSLPFNYPNGAAPTARADLPIPLAPAVTTITIPTAAAGGSGAASVRSGSVQDLIRRFQAAVSACQSFWSVMDDFDRECWVLEPNTSSSTEHIGRSFKTRRIAIGQHNSSVHIEIDPRRPFDLLSDCRFFGAESTVAPLNLRYNTNLSSWYSVHYRSF